MNNKKNILMVHNFYQIGGGEHTVYHNELKLLRNYGHKVIEYTRDNKEISDSFLYKIKLALGTIWSYRTYSEVKKIIKEDNIEIVHCHNTFPLISPSVYYAARKFNIPIVQTIHNFRFICPNGLLYSNGKICEKCIYNNNFRSALKNKCYRNSRIQTFIVILMIKIHRFLGTYKKINYIFLTEYNRKKFSSLININGDNVFVKPNFVEKHNDIINKFPKKHFIYMGRLDKNKGIEFLLESWKDIKDYDLHIYGDGIYKEKTIEYTKLYPNIIYYGFKEQKEIFDDLSCSQALIVPSECFESFSMTITESYSLGVPVLASNIGNQERLVNDSNAGITYKLYEKESFIKGVYNIIKNNEKYRNNALKYYNKYLTAEKNYEELMKIYENAKICK